MTMKDKSLIQTIPPWAMYALLYSDPTSLTDNESNELEMYSKELLEDGFSTRPKVSAEINFKSSNNINNTPGECYLVSFPKLQEK